MEMNKVLKFELLNNCISCDLYLLFTPVLRNCVCIQFSCLNIKTINQTSMFHPGLVLFDFIITPYGATELSQTHQETCIGRSRGIS